MRHALTTILITLLYMGGVVLLVVSVLLLLMTIRFGSPLPGTPFPRDLTDILRPVA